MTCQNLIVLSALPDASVSPLGLKATLSTDRWPVQDAARPRAVAGLEKRRDVALVDRARVGAPSGKLMCGKQKQQRDVGTGAEIGLGRRLQPRPGRLGG